MSVIIALCIGSTVIGIIFLIIFFRKAKYELKRKNWPTTNALIRKTRLITKWYLLQARGGFFGPRFDYILVREYSYIVNGKLYVQEEELQPTSYIIALGMSVVLLPIGSEVQIHYNPQDPKELTSEPKIRATTWYYLGFSLCLLMGTGLVIGLRLKYGG